MSDLTEPGTTDMKFTKETVLLRLRELSTSKDFALAEEFLKSPETVLFNPEIAGKRAGDRRVRPKEIVKTWTARRDHGIEIGKPLHGCDDFLDRLNGLPSTAEVVNVAFVSPAKTGLFWFEATSEKPIGFVIGHKGFDVVRATRRSND